MSLRLTAVIGLMVFSSMVYGQGYSEYETKVEVPEPLFVDLVRGLGAVKGEWSYGKMQML